jgi:hypothetical protein
MFTQVVRNLDEIKLGFLENGITTYVTMDVSDARHLADTLRAALAHDGYYGKAGETNGRAIRGGGVCGLRSQYGYVERDRVRAE